jgi:hypothetical protein
MMHFNGLVLGGTAGQLLIILDTQLKGQISTVYNKMAANVRDLDYQQYYMIYILYSKET